MGSSDRRGETNHYSTRHYLPAHFMVTRSTHVVRVACLVAHSYFHLSTPLRQLNCAVNAAGTVNKVAVLSDDRNHSKSAREHKRPLAAASGGTTYMCGNQSTHGAFCHVSSGWNFEKDETLIPP